MAYWYNPTPYTHSHISVSRWHPHCNKFTLPLLQHLLTQIMNASHSCRNTLKPGWISRRQGYWLWLILKHLWTCPMHMDPAAQTHTHTQGCWISTGVSSSRYYRQSGILSYNLNQGLNGENDRFGSSIFPAGQCFPKYLTAQFSCNNCGELFWLLFNQAQQTLIRFLSFFFLKNCRIMFLLWSVDDYHFSDRSGDTLDRLFAVKTLNVCVCV